MVNIKVVDRVEREVEIQTPYYFERVDDCDEIYGVIYDNRVCAITFYSNPQDSCCDMEITGDLSKYAGYLKPECKSTKERWQAALKITKDFF